MLGMELVFLIYEKRLALNAVTQNRTICAFTKTECVAYQMSRKLAGVAGFEPAHADTKNRCLTTWLHPNCARKYIMQGYRSSPVFNFMVRQLCQSLH